MERLSVFTAGLAMTFVAPWIVAFSENLLPVGYVWAGEMNGWMVGLFGLYIGMASLLDSA